MLAAQGRVADALAWAREQGLSATDDLSYLREFEHVTLARVLAAQSRAQRSAAPADDAARLCGASSRGSQAERTGSVIEILVLQALTHEARGDVLAALAALERALTLAEPEVRSRGRRRGTTDGVAAAKGRGTAAVLGLRPPAAAPAGPSPATARPAPGRALSERELDVLRLLSDLDGPDIARELTVSLNTLRTHTKNIYAKLGVNNRRAAVRQAAELNLLSRTHDR